MIMEVFQTTLSVFPKYAVLDLWPTKKYIFWPEILKSRSIVLCRIQCRFQNCLCFSSIIVSFWLLLFWRFKNPFYGRGILEWCFESINASNQGSYHMFLYYISAFMHYFIFSINLDVFYAIFYNDSHHVTMTSLIFSQIQMKFAQYM